MPSKESGHQPPDRLGRQKETLIEQQEQPPTQPGYIEISDLAFILLSFDSDRRVGNCFRASHGSSPTR